MDSRHIRDMDQETDGCVCLLVSYWRKVLSQDQDCICGRDPGRHAAGEDQELFRDQLSLLSAESFHIEAF